MARPSRKTIASAVLGDLKTKSAQLVAKELAAYLIEERRSRELEAIMRDVEVLRYAQDGVLEAQVTSVHELSAQTKRDIAHLLKAKHVILDVDVNPDVIGGVRVLALDSQLDLSAASKLNQLKHALVNPT